MGRDEHGYSGEKKKDHNTRNTIMKMVANWGLAQKIIAAILSLALISGGTMGASAVYNRFNTGGASGVLASISAPELDRFESKIVEDVYSMLADSLEGQIREDILSYLNENFDTLFETGGTSEEYAKLADQMTALRNNMTREIDALLSDLDLSQLSEEDVRELSNRVAAIVADNMAASGLLADTGTYVTRDEISSLVSGLTSSELTDLRQRLNDALSQLESAKSNYNSLSSQLNSIVNNIKSQNSATTQDITEVKNSVTNLTTTLNTDVNNINRTIDKKLNISDYNTFLNSYYEYVKNMDATIGTELVAIDERFSEVESTLSSALKDIDTIRNQELVELRESLMGQIDNNASLSSEQQALLKGMINDLRDTENGDMAAIREKLKAANDANEAALREAVANLTDLNSDLESQMKNLNDEQKSYLLNEINNLDEQTRSDLAAAKTDLNEVITNNYNTLNSVIEGTKSKVTDLYNKTATLKSEIDNKTAIKTATFDANGGKFSDQSTTRTQKVMVEQTIPEPEKPAREDNVFNGWKQNSSGNIYTSMATALTVKKDMTEDELAFIAVWTRLYKINYDGIEDIDSASLASLPTSFTEETAGTVKLPDITKPGYTFEGWIYDGQATPVHEPSVEDISNSAGKTSYDDFENISIKAVFKPVEIEIMFDYNLNSFMEEKLGSSLIKDGERVIGSSDNPVSLPATQTFYGTYKKSYGHEWLRNRLGNAWEDRFYETEADNLATIDGYDWPTILPNSEVYGYYFKGWYLGTELIEDFSTIEATEGPIVLKARWAKVPFVSYQINYWVQELDSAKRPDGEDGGTVAVHNDTNFMLSSSAAGSGKRGEAVCPFPIMIDGFQAPDLETISGMTQILGDDEVVFDFYYTRKKKTLTVKGDAKIGSITYKEVFPDGNYAGATSLTGTYSNYGNDPGLSVDLLYEMPVKLSVDNITTGYSLQGYLITEGNAKRFVEPDPEDGTLTLAMPATNMSVQAIHKTIPYTIHYDANGGTGSMDDDEFYYASYLSYDETGSATLVDKNNSNNSLKDNGFTAPAYNHFIGWGLDPNGPAIWGEKDGDKGIATKNIAANSYTGSDAGYNTSVIGAVELASGASGAGSAWKKETGGEGAGLSYGGETKTLYAIWRKDAYTVTVVNGSDSDAVAKKIDNKTIKALLNVSLGGSTSAPSKRYDVGDTVTLDATPNGQYTDGKWTYSGADDVLGTSDDVYDASNDRTDAGTHRKKNLHTYSFTKWILSGASAGNLTTKKISFTMPANAVTATAKGSCSVTAVLRSKYMPEKVVFDSSLAPWTKTTFRSSNNGGITCYCETYDLSELNLKGMDYVRCIVTGSPSGHYDNAWNWGIRYDSSNTNRPIIRPNSSWTGSLIPDPNCVTVYTKYLKDSGGGWVYYVTAYRLIIYAKGWGLE